MSLKRRICEAASISEETLKNTAGRIAKEVLGLSPEEWRSLTAKAGWLERTA